MNGQRTLLAFLAAAVVLAGIAGGAWAAGKIKADSKVTLHNQVAGVYFGKVSSEVPDCKPKRNVTVWHDEDADGVDEDDFKIGSDKTDRKGKWEVRGNQAPAGDRIIAEVLEEKVDHGLLCHDDTDTSRALRG